MTIGTASGVNISSWFTSSACSSFGFSQVSFPPYFSLASFDFSTFHFSNNMRQRLNGLTMGQLASANRADTSLRAILPECTSEVTISRRLFTA